MSEADSFGSAAWRERLRQQYRHALLDDVIPFWLRHGLDREHGGYLTAVDRDGSLLDSDKSVWFQGRGAWTFATLYNTIDARPEWLAAAQSGIEFMRRWCFAPDGKMYFTVTREGLPLRMRRYVYSEGFAAIAFAAYAKASGEAQAAADALRCFESYLRFSFTPGAIAPKVDPHTRPSQSISPHMMAIAIGQELRANLGDVAVSGRTCSQWIDSSIESIERHFCKPQHEAVMETVGPNGEIQDHFEGRMLNPGHAIEAAWFILHEAQLRQNDAKLISLGTTMLDWMWRRGWDTQYGGMLYFRDLYDRPVQEYWHDMKFWWPHNETIIATLLAYIITGRVQYAQWHQMVHDWSFAHFADPAYGEWFGYLHRDGSVSVPSKGTLWKGPFHLPRMLWYCCRLLDEADAV
jgi:N-acylglucosamine 2-epimerase